MRASHTLDISKRERTGSRFARREREAGRLPAVIYGRGHDPVPASLDAKEALRFFRQGEKIFNVRLEDEAEQQMVLLKDLQYDYLGTNVIHVDLERVNLQQEIESVVPIEFVGDPKEAYSPGAVLTHPVTSLTVRCAVKDLPEHIEVDISELTGGQYLHISELTLPPGVTVLDDPDTAVAGIEVGVTPAEEEEELEGGPEEPEVITERSEGGS